jgi:RNA polymerase sigma factor (sigma-70 family)
MRDIWTYRRHDIEMHDFPTTGLTLVGRLASAQQDVRSAAFESIAALYWKPIYKYLRLTHRKSNEEAQDLTQSFLAYALEKEFLGDYDPAKARFRTFLRLCVDRFAINESKAATREKRGGGALHLDFESAERETPMSTGETPEVVFEREWIRALFENAVATLRERWHGRDALTLFERYDLDDEHPTYQQLADDLHIPITTVTNHLAAIRRDFRSIALELLRETTATDDEMRDEARRLFGSKAV